MGVFPLDLRGDEVVDGGVDEGFGSPAFGHTLRVFKSSEVGSPACVGDPSVEELLFIDVADRFEVGMVLEDFFPDFSNFFF